MRLLRHLFSLFALLLTGCSAALGGHIDYHAESGLIDDLVESEPITLGLLASYRQTVSQSQLLADGLREALVSYEYRLGAGDVLSIIVYDHPELTIPAGSERSGADAGNEVRSYDNIFYPFICRAEVAGRTLEEVHVELTLLLADYITEPQVDVRMAAFNSQKAYVRGTAESLGTLLITRVPMTWVDAINQAGGAKDDANWHEVNFIRAGGVSEEMARPSGIFVIRGQKDGSDKLATLYQLESNATAFTLRSRLRSSAPG